MSKITYDVLTPSCTGYFIAVPIPYGNSGCQRVKFANRHDRAAVGLCDLYVRIVVCSSELNFIFLLLIIFTRCGHFMLTLMFALARFSFVTPSVEYFLCNIALLFTLNSQSVFSL